MNEFETIMEFFGEERPLRVSFETVLGDTCLEKVEVALEVDETYTNLGIYDPRVERRWLDITSVLSDRQALELTREIRADAAKQAAESYDDGRLQDWEERQQHRYAKAA